MPIWSEILAELAKTTAQGTPPDFDGVRRKYLLELHRHTSRNVILYASGWIQKEEVSPTLVSIGDEDIHALMEVTAGLEGPYVDLILHSPGGSPEAAEAIVSYLRSRFSHLRVIVPQLAMSAATMISCAADEVIMGKHSFLGPTDPQIVLPTPLGVRMVPAQAVLDQFEMAKKECADPTKLPVWLPMLSQYGPDLLMRCETALRLSQELVRTWLETYMFKEMLDRSGEAERLSRWFADHKQFKSHSRHIARAELQKNRLAVTALEDDQMLQDLVLSAFHATTHTFTGTPAVKIVENHTGRAFVKQQVIQPPQALQIGIGPPEGQGALPEFPSPN